MTVSGGTEAATASPRDRIDPESRAPLELMLERFPGGVNLIPDLALRRAVDDQLMLETAALLPANDGVVTHDVALSAPGSADPTVRVYCPVAADRDLPGIYFIHGGGMILGTLETEDHVATMLCEEIGAVVVSIDYRLAPEHPYPTPAEDCYAGLVWMAAHTGELGVDGDRIAVYGGSAGGGLALATTLMARDRGGPLVAFQMPVYPMLDDRNVTPSSQEILDVGVWDRVSNLEAWGYYLAGQDADQYAAPTRATDLTGLAPTYIDVGEVDLFRDEDIHFAARLLAAGVPTELHVYPGSYHASELIAPEAELSRRIWSARISALRRALQHTDRAGSPRTPLRPQGSASTL